VFQVKNDSWDRVYDLWVDGHRHVSFVIAKLSYPEESICLIGTRKTNRSEIVTDFFVTADFEFSNNMPNKRLRTTVSLFRYKRREKPNNQAKSLDSRYSMKTFLQQNVK